MIPMISNDSITKQFQWFIIIYNQWQNNLKPVTINYKMIPMIYNDLHSLQNNLKPITINYKII